MFCKWYNIQMQPNAFYHTLETAQIIHTIECNVNILYCLQAFSIEISFGNILWLQLIKSLGVESPDIKLFFVAVCETQPTLFLSVNWTPGRSLNGDQAIIPLEALWVWSLAFHRKARSPAHSCVVGAVLSTQCLLFPATELPNSVLYSFYFGWFCKLLVIFLWVVD